MILLRRKNYFLLKIKYNLLNFTGFVERIENNSSCIALLICCSGVGALQETQLERPEGPLVAKISEEKFLMKNRIINNFY